MHSAVFDGIDEELNLRATIKWKDGCVQSGLDADNWRRMSSPSFGSSSVDLRKSFAYFVKSICIKYIHISEAGLDNSLETFIAGLLILFDKNCGPRPVGVGEVLRRIAGKVAMYVAKKDV